MDGCDKTRVTPANSGHVVNHSSDKSSILFYMSPQTLTTNQYRIITEAGGIVDRSERGKLALTGPDTKELLNGQVTNDILSLEADHGCYAAFLTPKGKMLGDLRILDFGDRLFLDCERPVLQTLFDIIRRYKLGSDVELHKQTLQKALISLVGPKSQAIIDAQTDGLALGAEHDNTSGKISGIDVQLIRTNLGIDLIFDADETQTVVTELRSAGASVVSEEAADVLRVEHGRPRFGTDIDETVIPQEAGLNERAVSFTKGCYTGQETVARLHYRGRPNRHLRGLELSESAPSGTPVYLNDKIVGKLGSVVHSPELGPIALALIRREVEPGDHVTVGEDGSATRAQVVTLPFPTQNAAINHTET